MTFGYNDAIELIEKNKFQLQVIGDAYKIKCQKNHSCSPFSSLQVHSKASFIRCAKKNKDNFLDFCNICKNEKDMKVYYQKIEKEILEKNNHIITTFKEKNKHGHTPVLYTCGNCNEKDIQSTIKTLRKSEGHCRKCFKSDKNNKNIDFFKKLC